MRRIEIQNWKITSEFLRKVPFPEEENLPFNTRLGLYADSTNAG